MRFRWGGGEYAAEFIRKLESGAVIARAMGHGPRFTPGTEVEIQPHEIVSMDEPAPAAAPDADALQKAMDEERKALPSVAEVIANPNPTPPLSASSPAAAAPTPRTKPMTDATAMQSRLQEKAKLVAGAPGEVMSAVEHTFDEILAQKAALLERNEGVAAQHRKIIADAHQGLDTVEKALGLVSNGGPV